MRGNSCDERSFIKGARGELWCSRGGQTESETEASGRTVVHRGPQADGVRAVCGERRDRARRSRTIRKARRRDHRARNAAAAPPTALERVSNLRLSARPREGHPATLASRGTRCGHPDKNRELAALDSRRKRVYARLNALCAGMSGGGGRLEQEICSNLHVCGEDAGALTAGLRLQRLHIRLAA
jgi:hypothetical protein